MSTEYFEISTTFSRDIIIKVQKKLIITKYKKKKKEKICTPTPNSISLKTLLFTSQCLNSEQEGKKVQSSIGVQLSLSFMVESF